MSPEASKGVGGNAASDSAGGGRDGTARLEGSAAVSVKTENAHVLRRGDRISGNLSSPCVCKCVWVYCKETESDLFPTEGGWLDKSRARWTEILPVVSYVVIRNNEVGLYFLTWKYICDILLQEWQQVANSMHSIIPFFILSIYVYMSELHTRTVWKKTKIIQSASISWE